MFKHHNLRIRAGVQERLLNFGIDVPEIDSFLSSTSDPFIGLHSTYMQEKFYREKLGCIVSMHSPVSVFIYTTTLIIQETPLSTGWLLPYRIIEMSRWLKYLHFSPGLCLYMASSVHSQSVLAKAKPIEPVALYSTCSHTHKECCSCLLRMRGNVFSGVPLVRITRCR